MSRPSKGPLADPSGGLVGDLVEADRGREPEDPYPAVRGLARTWASIDVRRAVEIERALWASDAVIAARMAAHHHAPPPRGFSRWTSRAVRAVMGEVKT
jgi:hypothetical protein